MRFYLNITDDSPYNGFFDNTFCVLGFLLILISAFLAFSSLGAGLGQADAKTAWCKSGDLFDRNEREHGCCDLQPNYISCIGNSTSIRSLYINAMFHPSRRFTPINH